MLGKRKRRAQVGSRNSSTDTSADEIAAAELQARFQQHFEAKFRPLEGLSLSSKDAQDEEPRIDFLEADWEGLPDEDFTHSPRVIEHQHLQAVETDIPKDEAKAFMTAKPPMNGPASTSSRKPAESADPDEVASDAANLKKDLALQRLLKESHLLESQSALSLSGRHRHKAVDMRLQDLGSKTSLYAQQKMPMSHRKGIAAKAAEQEETRRREAQENGIILEKAAKMKKGSEVRRQRSIGAPTVGKFQGGMLKLSKKDVADIQGPKKGGKRKR